MHRGFTLLELMIVVSLAAVILSLGVPGFQDFIRNNRHATELNNLISTLQVARSEAVSRNRRIGICPTTDNTNCAGNTNWEVGWMVFVDENGDGSRAGGDEVLRSYEGPQQMTVRAEIRSLAYRPNGRIFTYPTPDDETPANFVFCDSRGADKARIVQLTIAGRPSAAKTKIDGSAPSCP